MMNVLELSEIIDFKSLSSVAYLDKLMPCSWEKKISVLCIKLVLHL